MMVSIYDLWRAFGGTCCYCGCDTYIPGRQPRRMVQRRFGIEPGAPRSGISLRFRQATREHIKRAADGGDDGADNLALACAFCNGDRQDATPEQHRETIARYIAAGLHPNHPSREHPSKRARERARRNLRSLESEAPCVGSQP